MVWLTTKGQENSKQAYKIIWQASLITVFILWPAIFLNKFFSLFIAALLLAIATYIDAQKGLFGRLSKKGVLGGIWLTIPLYIYLLPNT